MHPRTTTYDTSNQRDGLSHSSPSTSKTDTFEFDPSGIKPGSSAPHHPHHDDQDGGLPISTMPGFDQASPSDQGSETPPFPTMQMMERPDSPTSYRIPSSIFRTKSSAPADWSVASNESLFSIYTGNASFTREQLAWMEKSDEQMLVRSDTELFFSGPLLDFSGYTTPSNQPAAANEEEFGVAGGSNVLLEQQQQPCLSVNVTAPKSDELNADELTKQISLAKGVAHSPASSRVSDDGSCKSFAFPVFSRNDTSGLETPKRPVIPPGHSRKPTEPSSAKAKQEPKPELEPEPEPQPEVQPAKKPEAAASTSAASSACCAWFSCFKGCGVAPRS